MITDHIIKWAIAKVAADWDSPDPRYCKAVSVNHKGELTFTFKHEFLTPRTDTCPCVRKS